MYNNEAHYLKELARARQRTQDDLDEGGPDYDHVIIDALQHLEGAIDQGFKPWEAYNEPMSLYRVAVAAGDYKDIWAESLPQALEEFEKRFPTQVAVSVVKQV